MLDWKLKSKHLTHKYSFENKYVNRKFNLGNPWKYNSKRRSIREIKAQIRCWYIIEERKYYRETNPLKSEPLLARDASL